MKSGAESYTSSVPRGAALFDRVDYRLAETAEEKDVIYQMRYRAYLHSGLILPMESQRVVDKYDDAPNVWTFGVYVDGELCSSVRIHVLNKEWRASYTTDIYGDILNSRLDRGEVFVDPARLTADPERAQRFPELPYLTVRLGYLACEYFKADTGLAMVRPDHQPFYRRIFLHHPIAEPRPFPGWHTNSASLMETDFRSVRDKIMARLPIMRSSAFERRMLFERASQRKLISRPTLVPAPARPQAVASA